MICFRLRVMWKVPSCCKEDDYQWRHFVYPERNLLQIMYDLLQLHKRMPTDEEDDAEGVTPASEATPGQSRS